MRSRQYTWNLKNLPRKCMVNVYADRSVELLVEHLDTGEVVPRRHHLQTRDEAAFFLNFAHHEYDITKNYL